MLMNVCPPLPTVVVMSKLPGRLLPPLPNMIPDGFLEVGGIKHALIPLPFRRRVAARLFLVFVDGAELEIIGNRPLIELSGTPIYLEAFP